MTRGAQVPAIEWHEARRRAGAVASGAMIEEVALVDAMGLVLARDVVARQPIPHFVSSAMDGWAVVGEGPWSVGEGEVLAAGSAWAVVTGQRLPADVRGVLRSEHAVMIEGLLQTNHLAAPGEPASGKHMRAVGTEASQGEIVIKAGCVINPAHIALAAACGLDEVAVHPRPTASILLTGDEVTVTGVPQPGEVRDSFGPQLPTVMRMLGATVVSTVRVPDELDATVRAITTSAAHARIVITTGGTGRSDSDHLRAALELLDATMIIGAIALRPGAPTMLAQLPGGQFVVCLPGNPLAAIMGLLTVGAPLVAALGGRDVTPTYLVDLAGDVPGALSATQLLPYTTGSGRASPTAWRGSAMMRGLAAADGVLVIPPGGATTASAVEALPLPW